PLSCISCISWFEFDVSSLRLRPQNGQRRVADDTAAHEQTDNHTKNWDREKCDDRGWPGWRETGLEHKTPQSPGCRPGQRRAGERRAKAEGDIFDQQNGEN